jgi:hypothetical protein
MKNTLLALVSIMIVSVGSTYAQGNIDTKKYKFEMAIPEGFNFKLTENDDYSVIEGYNEATDTKIKAYAFMGESYSRESIVDFAVTETGIKGDSWEKVNDGIDENGFAWWDIYEAEVGDKVLYGVVAKNAFNDTRYLFFALATPESYEANQEQYVEWAVSCQGVK